MKESRAEDFNYFTYQVFQMTTNPLEKPLASFHISFREAKRESNILIIESSKDIVSWRIMTQVVDSICSIASG
jgi:hypothetical protein